MKKIVNSPNAPNPVGPYNQAIQAGAFLFVSGQLPIDPKTGKLAAADITIQTRQVMQNIQAILEAANYTLNDVVQATVYLTSLSLFEDFNLEYAKHFKTDFPARATVGGVELKPGALIEIAVVAYKQ
ncbi:MAG: Rid family detoxifying hydrolase [Candidatus Bathyarchaeota archaeon]|nr:Rid family detoxifying hydrolase [Candidatus Bathyarchaeota archaeon]